MAMLSTYAAPLDFSGTKLLTSNKYPQTSSNASYGVAFNPHQWAWDGARDAATGALRKPSEAMAGFGLPAFAGVPKPVIGASINNQITTELKPYVNVAEADKPPPVIHYKSLTKAQQKAIKKGWMVQTGWDTTGTPILADTGMSGKKTPSLTDGLMTNPALGLFRGISGGGV